MKETGFSFTEGGVLRPLLRFSLPVLLALLLQALYGAVDLIVVGRFAETADLSAVATGSQIMQSLTTVVTGMTTGVTVLLGHRIGEDRPEEAGRAIGTGICLFALLAAVLTALFTGFARGIAVFMRAPADALAPTAVYVRICSAGMVFITAFNVIGSVFRGIGDSKMPLITVSIACAVNVAGDLLLVGVCGLGAAGAALATVFAQAVSVVLSLFVIVRRPLPFRFSRRCLAVNREDAAGILRLGVPVALQDLLVSLSFLVIQIIVNDLGLTQSAGVGVAEKICAFIMLIPSAASQSMSAFVAQNIGAGKPERARRALLCGVAVSLACGILMAYLAFFHGGAMTRLFSDKDEAVVAAAADYLRSYAIDCLLTCFLFCFIGYFSGLGNTVFVMLQGLAGAFCVRIPVSYFVSRIPDVRLFYIGLATPCSTAVQIVMFLLFSLALRRKRKPGLFRIPEEK